MVHADGDGAVVGDRDRVARMRESALGLGTVARASLILSTNLKLGFRKKEDEKTCSHIMTAKLWIQNPMLWRLFFVHYMFGSKNGGGTGTFICTVCK